ncbi:SDR family NAD(P)-dependent oxidoreductase [Micromonosporaceae bacterium Da 78-11]
METSVVVTGGGRGVGRAIVERVLDAGDAVAVVEWESAALDWVGAHPAADRIVPIVGDAGDEAVAERAAGSAASLAPLRGWVNNAAVFRDAWLDRTPAAEFGDLIRLNLDPVVTGCAVAVRHFVAAGSGGSIVNISSHQAQRPVRGSSAYATAKAAVEGLTRALAVDYGPHRVRVNGLALGSIATERSAAHLAGLTGAGRVRAGDPAVAAARPDGRGRRGGGRRRLPAR